MSWAGTDRAWLRTVADPGRAAHVVAPIAKLARQLVERGSLAAAALAGLAAFVNNARPASVILAIAAAQLAVASVATAAIPSLHVMKGVLEALARGIAYRDGIAWDRAAQATAMVFCARGTLLLGEPQVAEIVQLGLATPEHLLSLVAGAELAASGPIASAVLREARARKLRADSVRSPTVVPGLGVTAITSSGEGCAVGSRVLMLNQHVPIAAVENRLAELEAHGRTVLLVAVNSKLIGMVALQDGVRPGARASVQYLLDAGIEPVLLSGDSRGNLRGYRAIARHRACPSGGPAGGPRQRDQAHCRIRGVGCSGGASIGGRERTGGRRCGGSAGFGGVDDGRVGHDAGRRRRAGCGAVAGDGAVEPRACTHRTGARSCARGGSSAGDRIRPGTGDVCPAGDAGGWVADVSARAGDGRAGSGASPAVKRGAGRGARSQPDEEGGWKLRSAQQELA